MSNFICIITGPAGAGKSTVTKLLAEKVERSASIEVDYLRHSIINGYEKPFLETEEVKKQLELSIVNACDLAKNFVKYGFNAFIDDVVASEDKLDQYYDLLKEYELKVFVLMPDKNILSKRDKLRPLDEQMGDRALELHNKFSSILDLDKWVAIDTSNQTKEETSQLIFEKYLSSLRS